MILPDCTCLSLNGSVQSAYNGQYYAQGSLYLDELVYKRQDCDTYQYIYEDPNAGIYYWLFGPSVGGNRGAVLSSQITVFPQNVTANNWMAFSAAAKAFTVDSTVQVSCSCSSKFGWILRDGNEMQNCKLIRCL